MKIQQKTELEKLALNVREHIIRMATDGGCFIGASLSCADIVTYIYGSGAFRIAPEAINDPDRDIILLSKGHDVPALYGILAELGYFDSLRLGNHLSTSDSIYWHPNRMIPGVEFHSGSLGHLLSVGAGIATALKRESRSARVIVILGDGELNEGSIWETCLVAAAHKLDNLIAIVDRNNFQANIETERLIPLDPLDVKFESFGWRCEMADGHSFDDLEQALSKLSVTSTNRPGVLIASTVRGKGLPSIERRADRWFANFSHEEIESLLLELHGEGAASLSSQGMVVR